MQYTVTLCYPAYLEFEVEADNEDEAYSKACDMECEPEIGELMWYEVAENTGSMQDVCTHVEVQ